MLQVWMNENRVGAVHLICVWDLGSTEMMKHKGCNVQTRVRITVLVLPPLFALCSLI